MEAGVKRFSIKHLFNKLEIYSIQIIHPDWPWWSKEAVLICDKLVKGTDVIIEFGSGRSTMWLAKKCKHITSIEHHTDWYNIVNKQITEAKLLSKINLILAPIKPDLTIEDQPYLIPVKDIDESTVDIVLVDGKFRAQAALLSLPKIKSGGILILDDVHRYLPQRGSSELFPENQYQEIWHEIENETKNWRAIWTTDGIHATVFLIKP
jgi:predicted O-methyltransferase YrrM